jgi:hypothetical protein
VSQGAWVSEGDKGLNQVKAEARDIYRYFFHSGTDGVEKGGTQTRRYLIMKSQPLPALLIALTVAGVLFFLYPPAPTFLVNGGYLEQRPSTQRDQATGDDRGAKNVLLPEKAVSAPKPGTQAKNEAESHDEKAFYDFLTGWGTAATAVFTLLMFFTAVGQVGLFFWQLRLISEGAADAKKAADAAKESADTGRQALIASQRAWIRVDEVFLAEDLSFGAGNATTDISVKITNVGNIPATNVSLMVKLVVLKRDGPFAWQELHKLCTSMKSRKLTGGFTIFPNDSFPRQSNPSKCSVSASKEDLEEGRLAGLDRDRVSFHIVGCVDYTFQTDATTHHQTAFICDLKLRNSMWVPLMEYADIPKNDFTVIEHFSAVGGIIT